MAQIFLKPNYIKSTTRPTIVCQVFNPQHNAPIGTLMDVVSLGLGKPKFNTLVFVFQYSSRHIISQLDLTLVQCSAN